MKEYNLSLIISLTFIQGLVSSQLLLYYSHMAFLMFLGPTRVIFSPKTLYMLLLLSFHYFHCGVSVIPSLARPTQWCPFSPSAFLSLHRQTTETSVGQCLPLTTFSVLTTHSPTSISCHCQNLPHHLLPFHERDLLITIYSPFQQFYLFCTLEYFVLGNLSFGFTILFLFM